MWHFLMQYPVISKEDFTNYIKKLGISTRPGTIMDQKKVLKQAGVVHNIKSL